MAAKRHPIIIKLLLQTLMQLNENRQLLERYHSNEAFFKKMSQVSSKFQQNEQLAHYSLPTGADKSIVVTLKKSEGQWWKHSKQGAINVQIIVGKRLPRGAKSIENILLNLSILIPRPSQPYSIIFINTLSDSSAYFDFKKVIEYLPIEYYTQLHNIYVLQASIKGKAFDLFNLITFNYLADYLKNKIRHYNLKIRCEEVLKMLPIEIVQEFSKSQSTSKSYLNNSKQNELISEKLNKSQLKLAKPKLIPKYLEEYEIGQTGAPLIIELLIYFFDEDEKYLAVEGLFRKSANIEEETALLAELDNKNYDSLAKITDPHLIANAIKRFLSNLREPLIPYRHFNTLKKASPEDLKPLLIEIVGQLDQCRKVTLVLLIDFFKEKLFTREYDNKMNKQNMSIVIGPCLMRSEQLSLQDIVYATKTVIPVALLILNDIESLFGGKKERTKMVRNSIRTNQRLVLKEKLGNLEQIPQDDIQFPIELCENFKSQKVAKSAIFEDQLFDEQGLSKQQMQNLEQADEFLNAFNKKKQ